VSGNPRSWLGPTNPWIAAGPPHESVIVRSSRGSSGWVPGGADLPGARRCHGCCQMRTLSRSALWVSLGHQHLRHVSLVGRNQHTLLDAQVPCHIG
jgi:hypothetical protein